MSRSGYVDDYDDDGLNLYRAAVEQAIKGKRGQAFLREMAAALDAMPEKVLIADSIVNTDGRACAIGVVALARRMDVSDLGDGSDQGDVAARFGIARSMAAEIAYENDECGRPAETPTERWTRMRKWVNEHLVQSARDE